MEVEKSEWDARQRESRALVQWMTLPLPALLTSKSGINTALRTQKGIMRKKKSSARLPPGGGDPSQNL